MSEVRRLGELVCSWVVIPHEALKAHGSVCSKLVARASCDLHMKGGGLGSCPLRQQLNVAGVEPSASSLFRWLPQRGDRPGRVIRPESANIHAKVEKWKEDVGLPPTKSIHGRIASVRTLTFCGSEAGSSVCLDCARP